MTKFKFGDRVECIHASEDNPQKRGFFVREGRHPRGAMNAGPYVEITDGEGVFWTSSPEYVCHDNWQPLAGAPTDEDLRIWRHMCEAARKWKSCPPERQGERFGEVDDWWLTKAKLESDSPEIVGRLIADLKRCREALGRILLNGDEFSAVYRIAREALNGK